MTDDKVMVETDEHECAIWADIPKSAFDKAIVLAEDEPDFYYVHFDEENRRIVLMSKEHEELAVTSY